MTISLKAWREVNEKPLFVINDVNFTKKDEMNARIVLVECDSDDHGVTLQCDENSGYCNTNSKKTYFIGPYLDGYYVDRRIIIKFFLT